MAPSRAKFGTDGIRGPVDTLITPALARRLGRFCGQVLGGDAVIIGIDTRASGPALATALAEGFAEAGVKPIKVGVVPTPCVAFLAQQRSTIGAMITASHNPWTDNGIKLFTSSGEKISDQEQNAIQALLDEASVLENFEGSVLAGAETEAAAMVASMGLIHDHPMEDTLPDAEEIAASGGTADTDSLTVPELSESWADAVVASADRRFESLKIVLDAGNGAASVFGPEILRRLGAEVIEIHTNPDGRNINKDCGSTNVGDLCSAVAQHKANAGVAFDGDADRLIMVDEHGEAIDGDCLMAIMANALHERGELNDATLVVTVMSNLGLHKAMESREIATHVVPVGDRNVVKALVDNEWSFGGEQSGHLVFSDISLTGDGILSAVQVFSVLAETGVSLSELASTSMTRFPQVLVNVKVAERRSDIATLIEKEIAEVEAHLKDNGRVLVRASGTEPLIRVMVEAAEQSEAEQHAATLKRAVLAVCGEPTRQ